MQGAAVLGLSAAAGTMSGPGLLSSRAGAQHKDLVLDYKPSQVTGWSPPYSPTHGGYAAAADFTQDGKSYRVSLVPFGQKGSKPQPLYESVPADPVIKFKQTLNKDWESTTPSGIRAACQAGPGSASSRTAREPACRATSTCLGRNRGQRG